MRRDFVTMFLAGFLSVALVIGAVMLIDSGTPSVDAQSLDGATWGSTYFEEPFYIDHLEAWIAEAPAECEVVPTSQINFWLHRCPEGVVIPDPE